MINTKIATRDDDDNEKDNNGKVDVPDDIGDKSDENDDDDDYQDYIRGTFQAMQVVNDNINDNDENDHPADNDDKAPLTKITSGELSKQCKLLMII